MKIKVRGKDSIDIQDEVLSRIFGLYPEERLLERPVLKKAVESGSLEFTSFKQECNKVSMSWQMFLLDSDKLGKELAHIESLRHKVIGTVVAKRKGLGDKTSRRILDRLIRCQNYIAEHGGFAKNSFCGSLKNSGVLAAAGKITSHFGIDASVFGQKSKAEALTHLVDKVESKQINVCQGVLANKMLPALPGSRTVYKNTSGFAMRNDKVPFIFIPSEINPDEKDGRQIYTLLYLVVRIGLDAYEYFLDKDLAASILGAKGEERRIHDIVGEIVLPTSKTDELRGVMITGEIRDDLARDRKITPSAVVNILRKRGLIKTEEEYEALLPLPFVPRPDNRHPRTPAIQNSVKKFNGRHVYETANREIKSGALKAIPAQYLLFGAVNKKNFLGYRKNLSL